MHWFSVDQMGLVVHVVHAVLVVHSELTTFVVIATDLIGIYEYHVITATTSELHIGYTCSWVSPIMHSWSRFFAYIPLMIVKRDLPTMVQNISIFLQDSNCQKHLFSNNHGTVERHKSLMVYIVDSPRSCIRRV